MYDLKPYDSSHAQPCVLTAEEEKLEELCNEERYLELHTDVAEKKLYEGQYRNCCMHFNPMHIEHFMTLNWAFTHVYPI